jgi:16S rRNA (cytidine1402-2'-O)-methyltransferase
MSGRLIVCPTPIGNLDDVTLRVLEALRNADFVACEDTRHTGKLLKRHGIEAKLVSYHEHNERRRAADLVERIRQGRTVALVSDAGMPAISDPGFVLVRACAGAGLPVEVLPGPSAPVTALAASALPADRSCFIGFLPRRKGELRRELERSHETLVAFESPNRLPATLAVLAELDPDRPVAVCRELTKLHEEVVRGSAAEVARRFAGGTRGEIVLVIGPTETAAEEMELDAALDAVERLVEAGARRRPAARVVSSLTGVPVNRLYGRAGA